MIFEFEKKAPKIAKSAYIAPNAVIIGEVEIEDEASIWFNCVVRGDINRIFVGRGSNIQDSCVMHVTNSHPMIVHERVAVSLLKHQAARNDLKGERNRLAYVRSKSDKEIDFVLVNSENEPELLVEAKQSETHVAPNLVYFAEKYAVHGVQVVQYLDHERQATSTVEVRDARGFLSTLS